MSKFNQRAHYGMGPVYTPSAREARTLQSEHELFDALEQGSRCAFLAARKLALYRNEQRWILLAQALDNIVKVAEKLGRDRQRAPLLDSNGIRVN